MLSDLSFNQITEAKPDTSYTKEAVDEMRAISIDKENWDLKGSYSFRGSKYPSDIDVSDVFASCCDADTVISKFAKQVQAIVADSLRANHWFLEFKAGTDYRYELYDYTIDDFERLHKEKLLPDDEFTLIFDILSGGATSEGYEVVDELLRQHATIRWSSDEVLSGYKVLPGGVGISLIDAIKDSKVLNMELIVVLNEKFTEMSNFFYLLYYSPDGTVHTINAPQESYDDFSTFFDRELKKNISKLYYSASGANYLKLAKRYFSYGRYFHDEQLVRAVYPLLNSDVGLAGQLKGELATIEKLITSVHFDSIPIPVLRSQLESIKSRLSNVLAIPTESLLMFNNNIIEILNTKYLSPDYILERLEPIMDYLASFTNDHAHTYLFSVGLVPPPPYLLP